MTETFEPIGTVAARIVDEIAATTDHAAPPADAWGHWRRRLKGEDLGCHDGQPQTGFYRTRGDRPVAIWHDGRVWQAKTGDRLASGYGEVCAVWERCHARPVTYDVYTAVAERGEPWPDQHPVTAEMRRDTLATSDRELVRADVERLAQEAARLIASGAATDEDSAARADDLQSALADLEKRADAARKADKEPHVKAAQEVDALWVPIRDQAARAKADVKRHVIKPFLKAKADAARKAAQSIGADSDGRAKTRGGRVKLVTRTIVECTGPAEALRYFAAMNDVPRDLIDAVEAVARRMVAAGVKDIPGITVTQEQKAA